MEKREVDEKQAEAVRKLFDGYIAGLGLKPAAENAGFEIYHGSAGRMLRNTHYLGDEYYPAVIDRERFDKAEEIRMSRASSLGRVKRNCRMHQNQWQIQCLPCRLLRENLQIHLNRQNMPTA